MDAVAAGRSIIGASTPRAAVTPRGSKLKAPVVGSPAKRATATATVRLPRFRAQPESNQGVTGLKGDAIEVANAETEVEEDVKSVASMDSLDRLMASSSDDDEKKGGDEEIESDSSEISL